MPLGQAGCFLLHLAVPPDSLQGIEQTRGEAFGVVERIGQG